MSVIIRLQNLPWSANAMDIRMFFRGLSIPEGGVHIVGGEQGDAFIAFSTDEDARQAMMNDGGKIKEVQVKLLLSSRSEMHKVIEAARQSVSFVQIVPPAVPAPQLPPSISGLLAQSVKIPPGLPQSFPLQKIEPAVVPASEVAIDSDKDSKRGKGNNERKSTRSRSRSRERKDRNKKDKRDRSRSRDRSRDRERRRRDRSRSRDRRDRRRDRKDRSRDRDRSKESNDARARKDDKKSDNFGDGYNNKPLQQPFLQNKGFNARGKEGLLGDFPHNNFRAELGNRHPIQMGPIRPQFPGNPRINMNNNWTDEPAPGNRLPPMHDRLNPRSNSIAGGRFGDDMVPMHRLQELDERRNPNAFQNPDNLPYNVRNEPRVPFADNRIPFHNAQDNPPVHHDLRNRYPQEPPPRGMCVKMQNLLSSIGYADIRRFFSGNFISNQGLKIINNDNGKRSGTAYVRFFQSESKQNALRKSGHPLKGRPIAISHLTDEEFDLAIDSYRPNKESECSGDENDSQKSIMIVENDDNDERPGEFKVLLLEDLPAFAKEHDIIKMFSDYSLLSITLVVTKDVRKQYLAYVQFVNAEDAKAAHQNKSKHIIGHKLIKASPCSESDFEIAKANHNSVEDVDAEPGGSVDSENYNRNDSSSVSRDPRQRRFENRQDDSNSSARNVQLYAAALAQNVHAPWRTGNSSAAAFADRDLGAAAKRPPPGDDVKLDCCFLKGLPLGTTNNDILDFFADINVVPTKIHLMLTIQGEPSGDCFCEFIDEEEATVATSKHNARLGVDAISVELVTKQVVDDALGIKSDGDFSRGFRGSRGFANNWGPRRTRGSSAPLFHNGNRGGHRFSGPAGDAPFAGGDGFGAPYAGGDGFGAPFVGADGFGAPGCVLALENVPFRSSIEEILDFFREFNLTQNHMIRRFNEKGHPTGDMRVCLRTPAEAQHAFQKLNLRCIRDRTITMTLL